MFALTFFFNLWALLFIFQISISLFTIRLYTYASTVGIEGSMGEEGRRQLYKNVASNIELVLAATPHKAPTIRSPTTYHENCTS